MKKVFYTELSYVLGILALALGTAFMERADFGMSMVVAPAYIIYLKISQYVSWFTFGMAEYCFQALIIIILSLLLFQFKIKYIFSFVTAFLYGNILDVLMRIIRLIPDGGIALRIIFFLVGMIICALGVSLVFHTYITPEAYELFVKEVSEKYNRDIHILKTVYDCCSCLIAVLMSFIFFGFGIFKGIGFGTIICAVANGWIISRFTHIFESRFEFKDRFELKKYFK